MAELFSFLSHSLTTKQGQNKQLGRCIENQDPISASLSPIGTMLHVRKQRKSFEDMSHNTQ